MGHASRPVWYTLTDRAEAALADAEQHPAPGGETAMYYRPEDGEKLPGDESGLGITRPEWHALQDDLLALNRHGALPGIRAIVAERLRQVRGGWPNEGTDPFRQAETELDMGETLRAAALLAAELDARYAARRDT